MYEIFILVDQGNHTENEAFGQRPEGTEAGENVVIWGKRAFQADRTAKCKGPEVGEQQFEEQQRSHCD